MDPVQPCPRPPASRAPQRPGRSPGAAKLGMGATPRGLVAALGIWSGLSVASGAIAWARGGSAVTRSFGRQTLAWGIINAGFAAYGASRPAPDPGRLRRVLLASVVADLGYIGVGLWVMRTPARRGDGAAVVVQGAFLLALDGHVAHHLEVPDRNSTAPPGVLSHRGAQRPDSTAHRGWGRRGALR